MVNAWGSYVGLIRGGFIETWRSLRLSLCVVRWTYFSLSDAMYELLEKSGLLRVV